MQSEPRLKQSWRQPSSNPVVNVKIRNLSLNISEAHKLSQECEIQQTGPGTYIQPSSLQCLCSNSGGKLMASEFLPSKKSLANKQSRHLDITFHSVQNLKKMGFSCLLFYSFPICFLLQNCSPSICLKHFTDHRGRAAKDCDYLSELLLGGGGGGGEPGQDTDQTKKTKPTNPETTDKSNSTNFLTNTFENC